MADLYNMSDVFLSYSRKDTEFMRKVFDSFKAEGKEVWADFEDIPKAADWWEEIKAGINAAYSFVFIISPDSVRSDICRDEIETAIAANKRFIPLLRREITEDEDKEKIHPVISSHNWIFFREGDDYDASFKILMESVETDLEHNRYMTRLLVRAQEWEMNDEASSFLLQGEDLDQAQDWLSHAMQKKPEPTDLHVHYITESQKEQKRRQQRLVAFMFTGLVISVILTIFAGFQWNDARIARERAEVAQEEAEITAIRSSSLALAAYANQALFNNNPDLALVLAKEAIETDASQSQVITSLADSAYTNGTKLRIPTGEQLFTSAYSPREDIVVSGASNGDLCLWDSNTGEEIICLEGHTDRITGIVYSRNGNNLLTSSHDGQLIWWDTDVESDAFGTALQTYIYEDSLIASIALSPDNGFALFGTGDGKVGEWKPQTGEFTGFFDGEHESVVQQLDISSSGLRAVSGDQDGVINHWYMRTRQPIQVLRHPDGFAGSITALAFNSGGQTLLSGHFNRDIFLWDLVTGEIIRNYDGHNETIQDVAWLEGDETFLSASWDNSILEWDTASGRIVRSFYGHSGGINDIHLNDNFTEFVTASYDTSLRVWSLQNYIVTDRLLTDGTGIWYADYSDEHNLVATAQSSGDVFLFEADTAERIRIIRGYEVPAIGVAINDDGNRLVILYQDNLVAMFDVEVGTRLWRKELSDLNPTRGRPFQVRFSPDSSEVGVVLPTGFAVLDTETGEQNEFWDSEGRQLLSANISQDGEMVAIGYNGVSDNLQIFDRESGERIHNLRGHVDGILDMHFNEDDSQLVSSSFDNNIILWDLTDGISLNTFFGHSDRVLSVSLQPGGDLIASASNDRSVRLWSIATGFEVFRYSEHTERVNSVKFSSDGESLVSASRDSLAIIWRTPQDLNELLDWTENNRYIRDMLCPERKLYLGEDIICNSDDVAEAELEATNDIDIDPVDEDTDEASDDSATVSDEDTSDS